MSTFRPLPLRLRALTCAALVYGGAFASGCGVSSRLFVADSDEDVDEDTTESTPVAPPRPVDAGSIGDGGSGDDPDDVQTRRLPCGTGPGCDITNLGGETCDSLGLGQGTLLCNTSTCTLETSLCTGLGDLPPCGTGPGCDTTNLGGATCESLGMPAGALRCDPITCAFDTAGCVATPGLIAGGLFGAGAAADEDGGTPAFFGGGTATGGLFGGGAGTGTAGGGLFGGGAATPGGGGTFGGGTPGGSGTFGSGTAGAGDDDAGP